MSDRKGFPEDWSHGLFVNLSGEIVNVSHIVRIQPRAGGTANVLFVDGKAMATQEPFNLVVSVVANTLPSPPKDTP